MTGAAVALAVASCSDTDMVGVNSHNTLVASISAPTESRTAVDDSNLAAGAVSLVWTDGDVIGAFDANGCNHTQYVKSSSGADAEGAFTAANAVSGFAPKYAYYPYDANAGSSASALVGTVDANQKVGTGNIPCDYKVGEFVSETNGVSKFQFDHIFSLVRVDLNAAGTILADEKLEYVKFTAQTDVAGQFTFSAVDGSVGTTITDGSKTITLTWPEGTTLAAELKEYFSVMPTIQAGDQLTFEVKSENYLFKFTASSKVSFVKGVLYNFPLNLLAVADKYAVTVTDNAGNPVDLIPTEPTPDPEPEPTTITGTFTCATYNVDGLKDISYIVGSINSDGPGSDGTKLMGGKINSEYKWDFFGVSENFHYNTELTNALSSYSHGTWRGDVTSVSGNKNTDGLGFFWKTNELTVTGESWTAFTKSAGGLTSGANTLISKGYRYYLVTLANGVEIDVYITHMNTYGNDERKEAQHAQLTQIADAILANNNGRPIIFMGDTNLRYTRHEILSRLINRINNTEGWSINDPWIDYMWDGDYEGVSNHGKSIMAFGPNSTTNADTDDFGPTGNGYGYQKGEIVDKVFYINRTSNKVQLKANGYLVDESYGTIDGTAFGDHYPVVIEFTYTATK